MNKTDQKDGLLETLSASVPAAAQQSDSSGLARLIGLIDDLTRRERRDDFVARFAAMQQDLPAIHKDTTGYGYDYASLPAIIAAVLPVMNKHGFMLTFETSLEADEHGGKTVKAVAIVSAAGDSIRSECLMPYDETVLADSKQGKKTGNSAQRAGAIFTYGRRYALNAVLGIAPDDDTDATDQAGSQKQKGAQQRPHGGGGYQRPPEGPVRINLNPGHGDNDAAKALGARWDFNERTFYATGHNLAELNRKFRDFHPQLTSAQKQTLAAATATPPPAAGAQSAFEGMTSEPLPGDDEAGTAPENPFSTLVFPPEILHKMNGTQRNLIRANEAIANKELQRISKPTSPELLKDIFTRACIMQGLENKISNWGQVNPETIQKAARA